MIYNYIFIKKSTNFKLILIVKKSLSIGTAAYSIQWFQIPLFVKDEMCMIMARAQKPTYITAGKLYIMHLENFTAVKILSYINVKNFR